jgi:putative DNA primase/helicase
MRRHDIPEDILRDALGLDPDGPRYAVTPLRQLPRNESTPTFPTDALPAPAKRLVDQAAKAIGCPPDAIALAALVALGSAIGNSRVVQPKRNWSESAAIYGAVIAESGEKKTAAVGAATQAIQKLEHRLQREHETAMEEFAREVREYKVEEKDAHKSGLAAPPPPRKPDAERVLTNDPTIEALIPILKENPRGLLLERDELVGWVKGMDQYKSGGKGSERQFWLSTWSGRPVSVDRKSQQGPVSVLKPFIGVIGGVQPDVLEDLAENREDGMLERFLFAYPRAINAKWTDDDIGDTTLTEYRALHERLRELSMKTDEEGDPMVGVVTFSPDAKEAYINAYDMHREEMGRPGFPRYLRSVWAKLEAYMLRLTLIVACCRFASEARGVAERVELEDVLKATKLTDYFKEQARRVFGTLRGYDEKKRLLEHVATFVEYAGGTWVGTATDLHNKLPYVHKPNRPDELSRFLKEAAHDEESFTYQSKTERIKNDEGEWESHRVLTLTIENGVTA